MSDIPQETNITTPNSTSAAASGSATGSSADNKFMGQKERRRSSAVKMFLGDHLSLLSNQSVLKLMAKNNDKEILFSDVIVKINKRHKMQDRIFLLTEGGVYNIDPNGYKCKRRIALKEIGSISLSKLPDNFFALQVPSEYDYLLVSSKKTEIVSKLLEAYEKATGKPLSVTFGNVFDYRVDQDTVREIQFSLVDGGVSTRIYTKKKSKDAKK
ncbi:hypothetical protein CAOG_07692 [Capsaspora owczarzaki ATCC 30864]|uniref:TH1 domain-containing protein n=1 Tax=Capsaspora owczarzaki (strain ATCC 30864) TaxID=595528 RepID=A0A0D2WX14_CAPO3|nr:hypothetical protein CAOG_07692 [Capsaspora owczarzaki ATCC 30864]KJE97253.1 hypothetical protein CAOG_007692 [Capsaspora owczarzaki ATCC 30864]|eukprot:XP_004343566.2 hypothetical protein CAOG_07692 [Capsaspora owczarzaki ATCC 30864]